MFHIALCEDNAAIRGQIRRYLDEYPGPETLVVREFPSGELLQGSLLSGQRYDLIILDIELERMSGIEVATFLRTRLREMYTPLIYISAHREYAMELFKTTPIDFLVKPIQRTELYAGIRTAAERYTAPRQFLDIVVEKIHCRVACCTIRYLESLNKQVKIVATGRIYMCYEKLASLSRRLPPEFIQIHKSFVVNHYFVAEYRAESLTLDDGRELAISRKYRGQVQERLLELECGLRKDGLS